MADINQWACARSTTAHTQKRLFVYQIYQWRSGSAFTSTRGGGGGVEEASHSGVKPRKQEELGRGSRLLPLHFPFRFFASPPPDDEDATSKAPLLLPDPIPTTTPAAPPNAYRSAERSKPSVIRAAIVVWIPRLTPA